MKHKLLIGWICGTISGVVFSQCLDKYPKLNILLGIVFVSLYILFSYIDDRMERKDARS